MNYQELTTLSIPSFYVNLIKDQANKKGLSINAYILSLIESDMQTNIRKEEKKEGI